MSVVLSQLTYLHINQILVFAIYALSLNLLFGYAGQFSVAHAAFGAIGGYTFGYLVVTDNLDPILGLCAGVALAALIGTAVGFLAGRLRGEWIILMTFAVASLIVEVIPDLNHPDLGGVEGIIGLNTVRFLGMSVATPSEFFPVACFFFVVVLVLCWRCAASPYGRALKGLREDPVALRSLALNSTKYQLQVFALTSAMAAVAGVLIGIDDGVATTSNYQFSFTVQIFAMVIIGGAGNLLGSILGAAIVVLAQPFLQDVVKVNPNDASSWQLVLYGLALLVMLRVRPSGLLAERVGAGGPISWFRRHMIDRNNKFISQLETRALTPSAIRGIGAPIRETEEELRHPRQDSAENGPKLVVEGISKSFGGISAVAQLSFQLRPGTITALVGPNGAGKTTVFNLLTGVISPDSGQIFLNDQDITHEVPYRIARLGMTRSFQDVRLFGRLTALENVMLAVPEQPGTHLGPLLLKPRSVARAEKVARDKAGYWLRFVGVTKVSDQATANLSFGEQKLVALARVLATECEVLLLDEPSSGVESQWIDSIVGLISDIRDAGHTICIVEHNLRVIEGLADRTLFMELQQITAEGRLGDLLQQERLAAAYFGSA